jgi:hypothetical protein
MDTIAMHMTFLSTLIAAATSSPDENGVAGGKFRVDEPYGLSWG